MKRCCLLLTILAMALFSGAGCERLQNPTAPESNDAIQKSQIKPPDYNAADVRAKLDAIVAKARAWVAQHQAQHFAKRAAGQMAAAANRKITVPDDYPTIQQAVDAAAPGDKIVVKDGTYNEFVLVGVPEIRIAAPGAVTVNGGFLVTANKVTIVHFSINVLFDPNLGVGVGVGVLGSSQAAISGVEVRDNTITGGDAGIALIITTACLVKNNHVSGTTNTNFGGIVLDEADGNKLDGNTATGNTQAGIGLFPTCDNNEISDNQCDANSNLGIVLQGNGNRLSRNRCNGNNIGILVGQANNNLIGSKNTANLNNDTGLWLLSGAVNNTVKNNAFLSNTNFDIFNAGTGNTFFKNKAVNTSGV
jgi:parallel beta-helix repeat protein